MLKLCGPLLCVSLYVGMLPSVAEQASPLEPDDRRRRRCLSLGEIWGVVERVVDVPTNHQASRRESKSKTQRKERITVSCRLNTTHSSVQSVEK